MRPVRYREAGRDGMRESIYGEVNVTLKDRVVIVTGASRGIGKSAAIALAQAGARVVVAARTETEKGKFPGTIHATVEEIEAAGGAALAVPCDVRREESVNAMAERVLERFGRIDTLVNNAAIGTYTPFLDMPVWEWDLVVAVGLRGPLLCTKAVLPAMIRQGGGSIVNISSRAADQIFSSTSPGVSPERPLPFIGQAYGAVKAALERLTWGLAAELGPHNIAVNSVKPMRPVLTEGFQLQMKGADFSTWVTPDLMVKAILFLAVQDAAGVTGTNTTDEELTAAHGLR